MTRFLNQTLRGALSDPAALIVAQGCQLEEPLVGGLDAALAAAKAADIVVLAVGESRNMSGEAQSRTYIGLPPIQQILVEEVASVGKPMVVLLRHGRALALEDSVKNAQAILATWFLGTETGNAVADVLFGAVNPSGRLPVSFPLENGQQPYFYNHRSTGRPAPDTEDNQSFKARWRSVRNEALYPFGHGLGYAPFKLSELALSTNSLGWDETLVVTATIANQGTVTGEHVVQLYVHDRVASRTRPVRELKGFTRVAVAPGEQRQVRFTLKREALMFIGEGDRWTVEPGWFDVWVANNSVDGLSGAFELRRRGR